MRRLRNKFLKELSVNKQLLDEVVSFYNTYGLRATTEKYNCDRTSLWRFFKDYNIKFNTIGIYNKTKEDPKLLQEILDYYKTHSLNQTGKHFNCHRETIKQILLENNIPAHSEQELTNITRKDNLEKFGAEWPMQSKEIMEKSKQTCRENYGTDHYLQTEECIENTKKICLERYGVTNVNKIPEIRQRIEQTNIEKYGSKSALGNDKIREQSKLTSLAKYGTENPMQNKEIQNKAKDTLFKLYGVRHTPQQNFIYNNIYFDSFPELCFYLYHTQNNINIKHEPIGIIYYFNNKEHTYYPDFQVDNQLYEIKGQQFLKEDGTWQCPFDHSKDALFEAKHKCAIQHNVKILYNAEYKKYIDWFNENGYKKEDFKFNKFKDKKC